MIRVLKGKGGKTVVTFPPSIMKLLLQDAAHLVGDILSNQHEHNVASMSVHGDEAHDALPVIPLQF